MKFFFKHIILILSYFILLPLQLTSQEKEGIKPIIKEIRKRNRPLSEELGAIRYIPSKKFMLQEFEGHDSLSFYFPEIVSTDDFYISSFEVTNKQYREFIDNVLDSIFLKMFGFVQIDSHDNEKVDYKKKMPVRKYFEYLNLADHLPVQALLYEINGVIHADAKKIVYNYRLGNKRIDIPIMPDTICWQQLYPFEYNQALPQSYLYHPAYDNYPVTGVSFSQAQAYCHWKTQQIKSAMYDNKVFDIICVLPSLYQWEAAAVSAPVTESHGELSRQSLSQNQMRQNQNKPVKAIANKIIELDCNFFSIEDANGYKIKNPGDDGGVYAMDVHSFKPGSNGLYNMKGNVAEWTLTNGDECYHQPEGLSSDSMRLANPGAVILKTPADSFLKRMQQTKIVKGGGWASNAFYIQPGVHQFYHPSTQHGAIGFRYVMLINRKAK